MESETPEGGRSEVAAASEISAGLGKSIQIKGFEVLIDKEDEKLVNEKSWAVTGKRLVTGFWQDGKHYTWSMGRYILAHHMNIKCGMVVCYKNKNTLDNRKENLIVQTKRENVEQAKPKSKYTRRSMRPGWPKGVYPKGNGFEVVLRVEGKTTYFGRFKVFQAAKQMAHWVETNLNV